MKILDRYIGAAVLKYSTLVMLVLLALFVFITFTDELRKTGQGSYGTWQAAEFAVLTIPNMMYQLFPATALIGSLLGLGILANNSELTVMRAAGVSVRAITWSVIKVGLLMVITLALIGELVAPRADRYAETERSLAMSERIALKTARGLWIREGDSFVNIREIFAGGRVGAVVIFDFDAAHRLHRVTRAKEAVYRGNDQWLLTALDITNIEGGTVSTRYRDEDVRPSLLSPNLLKAVAISPDAMSAWSLYKYIRYLDANGLDASRYRQAFWSRLVAPLGAGIMVLLAIPFVFGSLRNASVGHRILIGAILGISFHILSQIFGYVGLVYHLSPILAAFLPPLLFATIAIWMMKKIH